jgi:HemY protein
MKRLVIYFLVLLAAVWLGIIIHANPGYALFAYKNWSIEISLWLAILGIFLLFLLFHELLSFRTKLHLFAQRIHQWVKNSKHRKMVKGVYELIEGKWKTAESKLISAAKKPEIASINYLAAAYAAQKRHAIDQRDEYLYLAQKFSSPKTIAPLLIQAELFIANNQLEEALAILERLKQTKSRNFHILKLLSQVYLELHDWEALQKILAKLWRYKLLASDTLNNLEQKVYTELLQISIKNNRAHNFWSKLPRNIKYNNAVLLIYIDYLLTENNHILAENLLKQALHKNWHSALLQRYACIKSVNPLKQLKRAEIWLKQHQQDAALLLCLGQICKQQHLWGQARYYLENSLKIAPAPKTYYELGELMEMQNQPVLAIQYYKKIITN